MSTIRMNFPPYILWKNKYSRNNKMGGLKHLRCFPDHLGGFHKELTFCGTSVDVNVFSPEHNYNQIVIYGEFSQSNNMNMYIGCNLTKAKLKQYTYTQNGNCNRHYFTGSATKINKDGSCLYQINNERKGWHYGWLGKRHIVGVTHTFNVYAFSVENNVFTCIGIIRSPPFVISCIRKGYRKKQKNSQFFEDVVGEPELLHPLSVPAVDQELGQVSTVLSFALEDVDYPTTQRKVDNIKSSVSSFKDYVRQSPTPAALFYTPYNFNSYNSFNETNYNCCKQSSFNIIQAKEEQQHLVRV